MAMTAPDWLTRHGGALRAGVDRNVSVVVFADRPQYAVVPIPAEGTFGCEVIQTVNGKRLASPGIFSSPEDALRGGLEALRQVLGW